MSGTLYYYVLQPMLYSGKLSKFDIFIKVLKAEIKNVDVLNFV